MVDFTWGFPTKLEICEIRGAAHLPGANPVRAEI